MLQHSQLFLSDLMEQPKIPVFPQPQQFWHFIAHILHSVVLCHSHHLHLIVWRCMNVNLYFLGLSLLDLHLLIHIVVNVPAQLYFCSAQQCKCLLELLFRKVSLGSYQRIRNHFRHSQTLECGWFAYFAHCHAFLLFSMFYRVLYAGLLRDNFAALDWGWDFLEISQFGLDRPLNVFGDDGFGD